MDAMPTADAGAPEVRDCGYVQTAQRRVEAMRAAQKDTLVEPTSGELEKALAKSIRKLNLRAQNWRNRVYTIEFEDGSVAIAKQLVMGSDAMLRYQFEQLQRLAALNISGLRVPKALALLPQKRVLVMEFAAGKNIETLAWTSSDVLRACDLAGKILARIQAARTEDISAMPVELLGRDFAAAPWRLSRAEGELLQRTLEKLSRATVRKGQVYYDYKPANLLFHKNQLFLVDPPDTLWRGVHLWDYACFQSSMRRHGWRMTLRRPLDRARRIVLQQGQVAFERSYRATFTERYPEPGFFNLSVRLFELQRNAVLMTMQNAKVQLTREHASIAQGGRLGNPLGNRMTLPLLEFEKRWL
ncbi:MAG: hypothetical protein DLM52_03895, partial [Chthoniobacterales bacterium]